MNIQVPLLLVGITATAGVGVGTIAVNSGAISIEDLSLLTAGTAVEQQMPADVISPVTGKSHGGPTATNPTADGTGVSGVDTAMSTGTSGTTRNSGTTTTATSGSTASTSGGTSAGTGTTTATTHGTSSGSTTSTSTGTGSTSGSTGTHHEDGEDHEEHDEDEEGDD